MKPIEGYEIGQEDLIAQLGLLILEGRTPLDVKSNIRDCIDCGNDIIYHHKKEEFLSLWKSCDSMFIEVWLCHYDKFNEKEAMNGHSAYLIIEQWQININQNRNSEHGFHCTEKMLIQAVKSKLYFSQLSAWLNLTDGKFPRHLYFRFCQTENKTALKRFIKTPEFHQFPQVNITSASGLVVSLYSLPHSDISAEYPVFSWVLAEKPCQTPQRYSDSATHCSKKPSHAARKLEFGNRRSAHIREAASEQQPISHERKDVATPFCEICSISQEQLTSKLEHRTPNEIDNFKDRTVFGQDIDTLFLPGTRTTYVDKQNETNCSLKEQFRTSFLSEEAKFDKRTCKSVETDDKVSSFCQKTDMKTSCASLECCEYFTGKQENSFELENFVPKTSSLARHVRSSFQSRDRDCEKVLPVNFENIRHDPMDRHRLNSEITNFDRMMKKSWRVDEYGNVLHRTKKDLGNILPEVRHVMNEEYERKLQERIRKCCVSNRECTENEPEICERKSRNYRETEGNVFSEKAKAAISQRDSSTSRYHLRHASTGTLPIFHPSTGLPVSSSPAPYRKTSQKETVDDLCSPSREPSSLSERVSNLSKSAPTLITQSLLVNFEESVLNDRLLPDGLVEGFTAELSASGSRKCLAHVTLPVQAYFFKLSEDNAPSPYMGYISLDVPRLPKKGYHVPKKGTIQLTLFNPNKTVVKVFVVLYDFSDMRPNFQTFLRQKITSLVKSPGLVDRTYDNLHYLIHLRFASSKSGRVYLHTDIRLIFARHPPDQARLSTSTTGPTNPKYVPRQGTQEECLN